MKIALFGGGPACLIAAIQLSRNHEVVIYERGKRVGRKFLVAGNGGFNLTNAKDQEDLIKNYTQHQALKNALLQFGSNDLRIWLDNLGISTFIGTSGRVFPMKGIKPVQVLDTIISELKKNHVVIKTDTPLVGFSDEGVPLVKEGEVVLEHQADYYIYGLGGGSWSKTGSNDLWLQYFDQLGIRTLPFSPSNAGVNIDFTEEFKAKFQGFPLKNIACSVGDKEKVKGELLITNYGIEGNALYPLSNAIRTELEQGGSTLIIDFKPSNTLRDLEGRIQEKKVLPKNYGFIFKLSKAALNLIKEFSSKEEYLNPHRLIKKLKYFEVPVQSLRPVEEAISTVGGISLNEINHNFELHKHPKHYVVGEMLNWDAPTGGFLLQGCFSSGMAAANDILNKK